MRPAIIVHYHEIALKGGNRDWFERKLIENIRWAVRDVGGVEVKRMSGRVALRFDVPPLPSGGGGEGGWGDAVVERLQKVFGIANILVGHEVRQEYSDLEDDVIALVEGAVAKQVPGRVVVLQHLVGAGEGRWGGDGSRTFAVRVKRGNKQYPLNSMEIERKIGAAINEATGLAVNLTNPDLTVNIEIVERTAFVFVDTCAYADRFDVGAGPRPRPSGRTTTLRLRSGQARGRPYADSGQQVIGKVPGPGGLPVGVSGRVLCLLSSGFDSPVASWMMMKRGCIVDFVHFHSYPYTSDASKRNVEEMVRVLQPWQQKRGRLYNIPLIEYQKQILTQAPHEMRVLLYRRMMFRVADAIAREHRAEALVTGENLGQVASQTIPNMAAVETAASLPVFRPLLGFDKQEIINRAEAIGTAEVSKRPYDDCCSLFTPQHPATHATSEALDAVERDLRATEWTQKLLALVERVAL